jgi:hypothetical protein
MSKLGTRPNLESKPVPPALSGILRRIVEAPEADRLQAFTDGAISAAKRARRGMLDRDVAIARLIEVGDRYLGADKPRAVVEAAFLPDPRDRPINDTPTRANGHTNSAAHDGAQRTDETAECEDKQRYDERPAPQPENVRPAPAEPAKAHVAHQQRAPVEEQHEAELGDAHVADDEPIAPPPLIALIRSIALAPPDKKLETFAAAAREAALLVMRSELDLDIALKRLTEVASTHGIHADDAQAALGEAFCNFYREDNHRLDEIAQHQDAVRTKRPPCVDLVCEAWWRDPATIPARKFLDRDRHYCRGAVGSTIAAGGRAKTTRACYEAVSFAVGRDLGTGEQKPDGPKRTLLINGEEDQDELDLRIAAVCRHYGVTREDIGGRLFARSVSNGPMRVARLGSNGPVLDQNVINALTDFITWNRIDVWMIDPLVSFHGVLENDNGHMDFVIKEAFKAIAIKTRSAVELFHHPGKPRPGQAETSVEDARGASAVIWAVRSARVFNFMTQDESVKFGITEDERRLHIRIANGKANMGPTGKAKWMKLVVENMPNGDQVVVASPWEPPNPFEGVTTADLELAVELAATGEYRADSRSPEWFGYALAKRLDLAVKHGGESDPKDLAKVKNIIQTWIKNNVLAIEKRKDKDDKDRKFIITGSARPEPQTEGYVDDE